MERKRRMFGPLTWATLALAVVACVWSLAVVQIPRVQAWLRLQATVAQLKSEDPELRADARRELESQSVEFLEPLYLQLARDPRSEIRAEAIRTLIFDQDSLPSLTPAFINASNDPEAQVRQAAADALGNLLGWFRIRSRPDAVGLATAPRERLLKLTSDPEPDVRAAALGAIVLGDRDVGAIAALERGLGDPVRKVRSAALLGLMKLRGDADPAAVRVLVALVVDPAPQVDRLALTVMLLRPGKAAIDPAAAGLVVLIASDDDAVRTDALQCLQYLGPKAGAALPGLEALIANRDDSARSLAIDTVLAIEPEASPRTLDLRAAIIADPQEAIDRRMQHVDMVRRIAPGRLPGVASALVALLSDPQPRVRQEAHMILGSVVADTPTPRASAMIAPGR